jgi:hypothetical protein
MLTLDEWALPAEASAIPVAQAAIAVGLIVTTNTFSKLGFASAGGGAYFWRLAPCLVLLIAAFWISWWIFVR